MESQLLYFIGPLIGGFIFYALIQQITLAPGRALAAKFSGLGNLQGKTLEEIVHVVGSPQSRTPQSEGILQVQWLLSGYHIALLFKDHQCQGVTHEFLAH